MKFTAYIDEKDKKQLEFEVLSQDFYSFLTRYLMHWSEEPEFQESIIHRKNVIINLSNTILLRNIYVLHPDDDGGFHNGEYAWHDSNFFLSIRRLNTIQFIEFVGDLLDKDIFSIDFINGCLKKENASFLFEQTSERLKVKVFSISELDKDSFETEHPNIRLLVARMESSLESKDFANLLHASASIFETMAKNVVNSESVKDKSLGFFFERYRQVSKLPDDILDFILETYKKRNRTPLAGHGSISLPTIDIKEATTLCEMTKAFIRIESKLQREV